MKKLLLLSAIAFTLQAGAQETALCFRSTNGNYWKLSTVSVSPTATGTADVTIRSTSPRQTFKGWGTCFNELPWDAYNMLSSTQKTLFAKRLFNPDGDLRLTVGRIPVGASDYARGWYSSDEYDQDFQMEHFNIDRDLTTVIPSIRVAQAEQPAMTFWASPWSPPQWMKVNKHYAQRVTSTNGCPFGVPPYTNDQFIDSAKYYDAYCLYFDKFINAYREQGIPITALSYQNEAYSNTPYPGCSWTAATTGKFLGKYLGPYMKTHQPDVRLIVGTMNTNHTDVFNTILNSEGVSDYCSIIGFQWEGGQVIGNISTSYPAYEMWMTENECGSGTYDWAAAAHTFQLINHYLANKVTTYTYWNAILKDNGISPWGWVQNALVQVNSATNRPRYTAEYYAFKHYSHLIPAGSQILTVDEANLLLSAKTPDGNIVIVVGNEGNSTKTLTIDVDGQYLEATVPVKSFTSYVVGTDETKQKVLASEARGLVNIESASLSADQTATLNAALSSESYSSLLAAVEDVEKAEATVVTYKYTPVENAAAGGNYYLYDVTSGLFVGQKSGDTRTEMDASATMPLTVVKNGDYYELRKSSDSKYLKIGTYQGQFVWCDGAAGGAIDWTFAHNGDSTYTVSMAQDIVARDAAVAAGTYYLSAANATTNASEAHKYALVSALDYLTGDPQAIPSEQIDMSKVTITNTTNGNWNGDHLDWMDVGTVATYYLKASDASNYILSFKASSVKRNGATVKAELINSDGNTAWTTDISVANSGNWNTFNNYSAYIPEIPEGDYKLQLTFNAEAKAVDNIEGTCNMKGLVVDAPEAVVLNEDDTTAPETAACVNVTLNKSLKDGHWNTLCIPFTMSKPEGWQVYELGSAEGDNLNFIKSADDSLFAGKPYLVKPAADMTYITVRGVAINPSASSDVTAGDYTLKGNYAAINATQGAYVLNENAFYAAGDGTEQKGFGAYVTTTATTTAKQLNILTDGVVTGISAIHNSQSATQNSGDAYNLSGQRVSASYKGIVVRNGKKYINK